MKENPANDPQSLVFNKKKKSEMIQLYRNHITLILTLTVVLKNYSAAGKHRFNNIQDKCPIQHDKACHSFVNSEEVKWRKWPHRYSLVQKHVKSSVIRDWIILDHWFIEQMVVFALNPRLTSFTQLTCNDSDVSYSM